MIILLLVTFIAGSLNVPWLFLGLLTLFIVASGSVAISVVTILSVGALYMFNLQEYWFIVMFIIAGFILLMEGRKKKEGGGEYYSPELMSLLGGAE